MQNDKLQELKRLAEAATAGPWAYQEDSDAYTHIVRPVASPGRIIASATQTSKPEGEANGRFIAAANPAAVLELIAIAESRATVAAEDESVAEDVYNHIADMMAPYVSADGQLTAQHPLPASVTDTFQMLLAHYLAAHQVQASPHDEQIRAIESLGRNDPAVHAFLTLMRRDGLSWVDVLAQLVLHLAKDKAGLMARLLEIAAAAPAQPQVQPAGDAKDAEEFAYSTDEEQYRGHEATREAAIEAAIHEIDDDWTVIWTGRAVRFKPCGVAEYVIEQLQEQAHDECGEYAEDYLTSVTEEQEAELNRMIVDWASSVETPTFYTVTDVQQHDITDTRAAMQSAAGGAQ